MSTSRALPATVSAAAVYGWLGAAVAWANTSGWLDLNVLFTSYARLDQWVAFILGVCVGASVLVGRARHRREPLLLAAGAGILLGGVGALTGATIGLLISGDATATSFVIGRLVTWALMSSMTSLALATFSRTHRVACLMESAVLGALGGATAGAIYSLPGPSDLWLPFAMTLCGAAIGFAAVGPAMWRAPVIVHVLRSRDERHGLWSLHECAIESGWSMRVADAQVSCVDASIWVYPPPAGAVLDGYPLYRALPVSRDALLTVGRSRARLLMGRHS